MQLQISAGLIAALTAAGAESSDFAQPELKPGHKPRLALSELLRALDADAKIILMTGYASVTTAVESIKRGADQHLAKPTMAQPLVQMRERSPYGSTQPRR